MATEATEVLAKLLRADSSPSQIHDALQQVAMDAAQGDGDSVDMLLEAIDRQQLTYPAIARQLFNRDAQLEVQQDVLLEVARSIKGFRGEAHVTTWLYRLATNCALRYIKRQREYEGLPEEALLSDEARFTSMVANRRVVREAISELDEKYRRAVTLRDIEDLTYREVAEQLGLNINTARAHIARGRAIVAQRLKILLAEGERQ